MAGYKYHYNFVSELDHDLMCAICLEVAKEAKQHEDCGKIFCRMCIESDSSKTCPCCRGEKPIYFLDKASDTKILDLAVNCANLMDGCMWKGTVGMLEEHINMCDFTLVSCPNQCEMEQPHDNAVMVKVMRKNLKEHLSQCSKRDYQCEYCDITGKYNWILGEHSKVCPKKVVKCPNKNCTETIEWARLPVHVESCEYTEVPCKYNYLGCLVKKMRRDIVKHEEENDCHLTAASEEIARLSSTISSLQEKIKSFEELHVNILKSGEPIRCKIENYKDHRDQKSVLKFKPVYSSIRGFKLQVTIYLDGIEENPDTRGYLSVYFTIMKGFYDEEQDWPFKQKIKIEIGNKDRQFSKVLESHAGQHVGSSWGLQNFISHTDLERGDCYGRPYLCNDCAYFQISLLEDKLWLNCTI